MNSPTDLPGVRPQSPTMDLSQGGAFLVTPGTDVGLASETTTQSPDGPSVGPQCDTLRAPLTQSSKS